jgi:hypothetical protein
MTVLPLPGVSDSVTGVELGVRRGSHSTGASFRLDNKRKSLGLGYIIAVERILIIGSTVPLIGTRAHPAAVTDDQIPSL